MNKTIATLLTLLLATTSVNLYADMEVTTPDGRTALLKEDKTWRYLDEMPSEDEASQQATLSVVSTKNRNSACVIGLRLQNDLPDPITNIVFNFSAYKPDDILYETATRGFLRIKPTNSQYKEIMFTDVDCREIEYVRVHGGDRCEIGDLNKFSAEKGVCLSLIRVAASDKISIFKRYQELSEEKEDNTSDEPLLEEDPSLLEDISDESESELDLM